MAWKIRQFLVALPFLKTLVAVYRRRDLEAWPAWLGVLCDIKVPQRVVPHEKPLPSGSANIRIVLELVRETAGIDGDIAECGVFRGETLIPLTLYAEQLGLKKKVMGFDSFEGFGSKVAPDLLLGGAGDSDKNAQGFSRTSLRFVQTKLQVFDLERRVKLEKGYFQDTLSSSKDKRFSFVHLDCDLYESYRVCLEFFYPRMNKGGIILLDEYNDPPWPGCNKAVDEFLVGKPEKCREIVRDNYVKYFLRKESA